MVATPTSAADGEVNTVLGRVAQVPTAFWVSSRSRISGPGTGTVEGILADAAAKSPPQLVVLVLHNLPNRDCAAEVPRAEICCHYLAAGVCNYTAPSQCETGLAEYESSYVNPIVGLLRQHEPRVPMVVVLEPRSMANLAVNQVDPRCSSAATTAAYRRGISYAVQTIAAAAPNVGIYLDAGNGASLGWPATVTAYIEIVKELGVIPYVRGFATNVAAYQPLGHLCPSYDYCLRGEHPENSCCEDPCGFNAQFNPAHTELSYAQQLRETMSDAIGSFQPYMIIDTGRNGAPDPPSWCTTWCNVRGAGFGRSSTSETADRSFLDAYFWINPPGLSDGCSQMLPDGSPCQQYDAACGCNGSLGTSPGEPRAPKADQWFDYQLRALAANAQLS